MAVINKSTTLSAELHDYIVAHGSPPDPICRALTEETRESVGPMAMMQIAPEQGAFMSFFVRALGVREAIEIGTFTGYSALCIARGLPADGHLLCCDVSEEWTAIGKRYWEKAGVADRIELRLAPAIKTLRSLPREPRFDFAFLDADKKSYEAYLDEILPRLEPGGVILVDNVLWGGNVIRPDSDDESTQAIRAFNDRVASDPTLESVMLPVADGLTFIQRTGSDSVVSG